MPSIRDSWSALVAAALFPLLAVGTMSAQAAVDSLTSKRAAFIQATEDLAAAQVKLKQSDAARDAATLAFDEGVKADAPDLAARALLAQQRHEAAERDESQVRAERMRVAYARRALMDAVLQPPIASIAAEKTPTTIELIENAAKAQAKVEKLEADAATAFNVADKANALALSIAVKRLKSGAGGVEDELKALANARVGHEAASDVHDAWRRGEGAQRLGNRIVASGADLAKCRLEGKGADCQAEEAASRELQAQFDQRAKESASKLTQAKLAHFKVQAAEAGSSAQEQQEALDFLQLIDRNPKAGWKFGGEAATLTAGPEGAAATIRFSLQRFVRSFARDTAITLSAPLAKEGETRLLSSNGTYRPSETTLRFEVAGVRSLKQSKTQFTRFNQFGYFAEVRRQQFKLGNGDITGAPAEEERTALAAGVSNLYAFMDKKAVHRVGFSIERGHDAGTASIRCKKTPDKVKDPATGELTVDEDFLRCANALFSPIKQVMARTLEYRWRQEFDDLAIAPAFSYEHRTRTKTYELPLYLIGDNDGKFTAGVAYRHTSKPGAETDKRWELFVSSPLSLLGP